MSVLEINVSKVRAVRKKGNPFILHENLIVILAFALYAMLIWRL